LGLGLYANANLRSPGVVVPTPGAAATPAPTNALPVAAATPQVPTPKPQAAGPTPTSPPQPTVVPRPTANVDLTQQAPATADTPTPSPDAAAKTESPTPLPTVEPTLAADVGQAYENFWRVRSQALLELDPTHLPEVMDGEYLDSTARRIEELRSEGQAIKTQVSLSYSVLQATADFASVVDDIIDNSVYVRIGTEDALSEPTADQLRVLYKLRNVGGIWKVVDSVRSD
jgi:hypothetical protein